MRVGGDFCFGGPVEYDTNICAGDSGGPVVGFSSPEATSGEIRIYGVSSYAPGYCGLSFWDSKAQAVGGHNAWIDDVTAWNERPGVASGTASLVLYDPAHSTASTVDVAESGWQFSPATQPTRSVVGADMLGTAYFGGPDPATEDVLFYSSATGRFQFASVSPPDEIGHRDMEVFVDVNGTRGWTHVITGDYNGDGTGDVLFYRASDGMIVFYTTTPTGRFIPITPVMYGNRGWTHLVVGDYNADGTDDVLWYRASDGLIRFYEVTSTGGFRPITPVYYGMTNWTTIPAGDFNGDGSDDVLWYRRDGVARFYEVDATGTFRALGAPFYPDAGYSQIESAELTADTPGVDLVWYHAGNDWIRATRFDADDVVDLWGRQSSSVFGDDLVIATGMFRR
jgi:hypothetical protein